MFSILLQWRVLPTWKCVNLAPLTPVGHDTKQRERHPRAHHQAQHFYTFCKINTCNSCIFGDVCLPLPPSLHRGGNYDQDGSEDVTSRQHDRGRRHGPPGTPFWRLVPREPEETLWSQRDLRECLQVPPNPSPPHVCVSGSESSDRLRDLPLMCF